MHCSLSFKAASNKYDSLKIRVFSCFRVGKAKPDPAFHHLDSGVCQIIQVVDRDWVLFHNHRDQKWLWKPPCVGRQPVHQGIAASEDDCCIVRWRSEYCELKSKGGNRWNCHRATGCWFQPVDGSISMATQLRAFGSLTIVIEYPHFS